MKSTYTKSKKRNGAHSAQKNNVFDKAKNAMKSIPSMIFTSEFLQRLKQSKSDKSKTVKSNKKKSRKNGMKPFKKVLLVLLVIFILAAIGGSIFFIPYISTAIESYNEGFDTSRIDVESVPHIYDKDGNLIAIMYGYYDSNEAGVVPTYSSAYVNAHTLPNYVSGAFTAIEDETFYDNMGISFNRLIYATFNYVIKGDSSFGASTITQQLIKVTTGDDSHSAKRKAREIGTALYLTDHWSKDKILASYMNLVYYGSGAYGIYEASYTYFNCAPQDLNIAQAAIIASLPNAPEVLTPYGGEANQTRLFNRQKLVLKKMLELNVITEEEYKEATEFEIVFTNGSGSLAKNDPAIQQYLKVGISESLDIIKAKYNCDTNKAREIMLSGKTSITLNMDRNLQKKAHDIAKDTYADKGDDFELGAVLTTKNGEVLAIVASRTDAQLDHAYVTNKENLRQTGSAIKPISVYGPAYDKGLLTPGSAVWDVPTSVKLDNGKVWNVNNASRSYRGQITAQDAVAYSLNTVAVDTLGKVGLDDSLAYLKSFGITSMDDDKMFSSLALGGMTYGISPYELTQAYNALSNDGTFRTISTVKSLKIDGITLTKERNEHQVISPGAAGMVKQSMKAVGDYGTARTAKLGYTTTYLKTGTTSNANDIWTCGFTDDVTMCMWGGYNQPRTVNMYNVNAAWTGIMNSYYGK